MAEAQAELSAISTVSRRRGPQPIPRPPAAELRRLYVSERLGLEDIALRYHVSDWTVRVWLNIEQIHRSRPTRRRLLSAKRLRRLYVDQGLTIEQIARREHVAPNTVWYALRDYGIPRRRGGHPIPPRPSDDELRRRYVDEDWSIRQLAAHFKASYTTARLWLRAAGIPCRPPGYWRRPQRIPRGSPGTDTTVSSANPAASSGPP
jgi:hypothetical protein